MTRSPRGVPRRARVALAVVGLVAAATLAPSPASAGPAFPVFVDPSPADGAVITAAADQFVQVTLKAEDADGDDMEILFDAVPADAVLFTGVPASPITAIMQWVPGLTGDFSVAVRAVDSDGNETPLRFTIRVSEQTVAQLCQLPDDTVGKVVSWGGKPLIQPRKKSTGLVAVPPPPSGTYNIDLVSFDPSHAAGAFTDQTEEQWVVQVFRNNVLIFTSDPIDDLAETRTTMRQRVGEVPIVGFGRYKARAVHVGSSASPNSIVPACVVFADRGR